MSFETLTDRSYVPYSNKPAACAVAGKNGSLFPGVRIENISFPLTISAAQSSLFTCLSEAEQPETLYIDTSADEHLEFWKKTYDLRIGHPEELDSRNFQTVTVEDSDKEISDLLSQRLDRAVVPNSQFQVAAVLETGEGLIFGANIEIEGAAWEMGLCAERVALAKTIAYGITDLKAMHILTRRGDYSSPCGACRQVLVEHIPHHPIFIHHPDGSVSRHFSTDLLPYSFKSDFLMRSEKG